MATCRFCGHQFENSQAVRAHLKGCAAYRQRSHNQHDASGNGVLREQSLGTASGSAEPRDESLRERWPQAERDYDEVTALQKRLSAERLRLQLRGVQKAHSDLDEQAQSKAAERERQTEQQARAAEAAQREQEEVRRRSEQARQERECREKAEREKTDRRRAIVQRVKKDATSFWWPNVPDETALKSAVLCAVERELATLPLEELPHDELVLIAKGIRDKLTREATRAQDTAKRLSDRREKLIQHGIRYADRELESVEGLGAFDKWHIQTRIKEELSGIGGEETTEDIEEMVEGILDEEGIGLEDDSDEDAEEYED